MIAWNLHRTPHRQVFPIGIDLGHDSLKLIQLERIGNQLRVRSSLRYRREQSTESLGSDRMARVLRRLVRCGNFVGRSVVTAVPWRALHTKNLRLPPMDSVQTRAAVECDAPALLGFNAGEGRIQYLTAGQVRQGGQSGQGGQTHQELIVLGTRHQDMDAHLQQLEQASVTATAVDTEPTALFRCAYHLLRQEARDVCVLVDIGLWRTQVLIGHHAQPSFFKAIDIGGQHLTQAVSRKLGITPDEAKALRQRLAQSSGTQETVRQAVFDATRSTLLELGRELSLCLRYYAVTFRGFRPRTMHLCGGEAMDPQLQQALAHTLSLSVEAAAPLAHVDASAMCADRSALASEWCLAMGLALRFATLPPADAVPSGDRVHDALEANESLIQGETAHV